MALNVIYYIARKEYNIQELKIYHTLIPGLIQVVFDKKEQLLTVIDLKSYHPGKEYATHLMIHACKEAKKRGITNITLDDCSDRYRNNNNIYIKLGMNYEYEKDGPEMIGYVDKISKYKTSHDSPTIFSKENS
jgi:hypothetical protein